MRRTALFVGGLGLLCWLLTGIGGLASASEGTAPGTAPVSAGAGEMDARDQSAALAGGLSQIYKTSGRVFLSVDGGTELGGIEVEKPHAKAVVRKAFVLAASNWNYVVANGDVSIEGSPITWKGSYINGIFPDYPTWFNNVWADVTSVVKPKVDAAPAGRIPISMSETTNYIDGYVLAVVFYNPAQTVTRTVVLLFGGQKLAGDIFVITFAAPFDPTERGAVADMGLGISFSYGPAGQYSNVSVNGQLLSSCAGDYNDGYGSNGGLITVGGLDDSRANPGQCSYPEDDELYTLRPFISKGDTSATVSTQNPSNDDNIFFAYFVSSVPLDVNKDTDGDALPDLWETEGYDEDGDGVPEVDLPGMGANPNRKDIFMEVDWMVGGDHNHKPLATAVSNVVAAFANAPVSNPNGSRGITLHVDTGNLGGGNAVAHDDDLNPVWTEFDAIKNANFDPVRSQIFHYCLFAHNYEGGSSSGLSRGIPASDFIVSLGSWTNQVGTRKQQAGTLMHEFGHNLGLMHGGSDHVNYKPNFLSIMNYFFQVDWLRYNGSDNRLDYSRLLVRALDESNLSEPGGLNSPSSLLSRFGTRFFYALDSSKVVNVSSVNVDWNNNGALTTGVSVDLNNDGALGVLAATPNEWGRITFNGGTIGAGVRPAALAPSDVVMKELTVEEYLRMVNPSAVIDLH